MCGELKVQAGEDVPVTCVVCLGSSEISVDKTDYLWPLPSRQIEMNPESGAESGLLKKLINPFIELQI